jgi:hypothetical protein
MGKQNVEAADVGRRLFRLPRFHFRIIFPLPDVFGNSTGRFRYNVSGGAFG